MTAIKLIQLLRTGHYVFEFWQIAVRWRFVSEYFEHRIRMPDQRLQCDDCACAVPEYASRLVRRDMLQKCSCVVCVRVEAMVVVLWLRI